MAELLDTEAEVQGDASEDEDDEFNDLFDTEENDDFLDNTEFTESPPFKKLCDSAEKLMLNNPLIRGLTCTRELFASGSLDPNKCINAEVSNGMLTYDVEESESLAIEANVENSELPIEGTVIDDPDLREEQLQRDLKKSFVYFSQDLHPSKFQGKFLELHKMMKSQKTMQKIWAVFCRNPPVQQLHEGSWQSTKKVLERRSHISVEAVLSNDCDRIRGCSTKSHCYYLLQYTKGQRSMNGLMSILKHVGVENALIGVPYFKQPLTRTFLQAITTPLHVERDVTFLQEEDNEDFVKQSFTFRMEELITFCEDDEPDTIEQLISRYSNLAKQGDPNAIAWRNSTNCLGIARNAFQLWQSTMQGAELDLTLSEFIMKRCSEFPNGDWKNMTRLLLFHGILDADFCNKLRKWLRGDIKHNVIVFQGPGNTGKSMITDAIIKLLNGAFLSWHGDNQYWKSPALGCRFCCLDDLTKQGWENLDATERRTLDGGTITINKKFHQPTKTKFPPMIITTNKELDEEKYEFLRNRLTWFFFKKVLPQVAGKRPILVSSADVADWILKYKDCLDLE